MTEERPIPGPSTTADQDAPTLASDVRRRTAAGVVTVVARGFAIRLIGFVGTLVLARLLLPSDFGYLTLGLSLVAIGQFLATGGLGVALIGQDSEPTQRQLGAVLGFQLVATTVVAVVIGGIASFFGTGGQVAAIMIAGLPFDAARAPKVIVLERRLAYQALTRAEIAENLAYGLLSVLFVALGAGVWGVAAATVARAIIGFGLFFRLAPRGLPRPMLAMDEIRSIWRFGAAFQGVQFATLARDFGFNVVVSAIAGASIIGLWGFALRLLQPILVVILSLYRVSFPATAQLAGAGADIAASLARALNLATLAMGATLVAIASTSAVLVPVVFGDIWTDAVPVIFLGCIALMINGAVSGCVTGYLLAFGDTATIVRATVAHTIVLYGVTFPLLPSLQAVAIGCGVILSSTVDLLVLGHAVTVRTGVRAVRQTLPSLAAGIVGAAGGWAVGSIVDVGVASAAVALVEGQVLYFGLLLVLQRRSVVDAVATGRRLFREQPATRAAG